MAENLDPVAAIRERANNTADPLMRLRLLASAAKLEWQLAAAALAGDPASGSGLEITKLQRAAVEAERAWREISMLKTTKNRFE